MAKFQIVELEDFKVKINELRIKDVRKVLSNIKEVFDDVDLDIEKLVDEKLDVILEIAGGFIKVESTEYTLEDLTFTDIDLLTPAFKEVNASFLDKLTSMGLTPSALLPPTEQEQIQSQD